MRRVVTHKRPRFGLCAGAGGLFQALQGRIYGDFGLFPCWLAFPALERPVLRGVDTSSLK
jgi:hypothetical protein